MGLKKTLRKICDYNPVFGTKLRKKLGLTGKQVKSKLFGSGVSSAGSYNTWSQGVYGQTGSIVGRF